MVIIQAVTIPLATPQRTADTFFAAPTPMMQPVIVCVVDTGMPSSVAANNMIEPRLSAAALHRCQPCNLAAHGANDAPAARKRTHSHCELAGNDYGERHMEFGTEITLRIEKHRNDAHCLLGIIAAVAERIASGGHKLRVAKNIVHPVRGKSNKRP